MKINKFIIVAILLILSSTAFGNDLADTQAAVKSFYDFHRTRSGVFNEREVAAHKKWFSADLYKLFLNELKREKEYLKKNPTDKPYFGDGFPFQPIEECCPDNKCISNPYSFGQTFVKDKSAEVEVKFSTPKECGGAFLISHKIELVKTKGKWLIDDMIYADGKKLSDDLKREKY